MAKWTDRTPGSCIILHLYYRLYSAVDSSLQSIKENSSVARAERHDIRYQKWVIHRNITFSAMLLHPSVWSQSSHFICGASDLQLHERLLNIDDPIRDNRSCYSVVGNYLTALTSPFHEQERKSTSTRCAEAYSTNVCYLCAFSGRIRGKGKRQTSCHVVALFSSNINGLNQQTVRSTTGPPGERTPTFHIRTHLLRVVKTSLNNLFELNKNINAKQKEKGGELGNKNTK